ncbi:hypothetical protein Salat_1127300 [Sesamum alatum]|uniref:Uncharacterized protein n=1 Tax=Sesamum alatum TaxID=300844 RepID=A0AAE1YDY8_9LAMI|nr:hypothetical protein Salat_1127300 [Sesamum alatum]
MLITVNASHSAAQNQPPTSPTEILANSHIIPKIGLSIGKQTYLGETSSKMVVQNYSLAEEVEDTAEVQDSEEYQVITPISNSNKTAASTTAYATTSASSTAAYAASVVSSVASACPPQEIFSLVDQISSSRSKAAVATDAYAASVVSSVASACLPPT